MTLIVRLLGPVEVTTSDGRDVPAGVLWRKNLGLLVYLLLSPRRARSREHLVGVFWPERGESAARHSLREAVRVVRRALDDGLDTTGDRVAVQDGAVDVDTERFAELAAATRWIDAASLVQGDLLEGFTIPDAPAFEDWLALERRAWRSRGVDALVAAADAHTTRGDLVAATSAAGRAVRLDPLADHAVRAAMRIEALAGSTGAAVDLYEHFRKRLEDAAGAEPDAATRALLERVRGGQRGPVGRPAPMSPEPAPLRAPLVGRATALHLLQEAWNADQGGQATVLLIQGDAGSGRSRLLEELVERVRLDGATVSRARLVPGDRDVPLAGLSALTRPLVDAPGVVAVAPQVLATLAARFPEWAARFPGAHGTVTLADACIAIIEHVAAEGPLLLALDDAQWLDAESLRVLEGILRDLAARPVGLALTTHRAASGDMLDGLRTRLDRELAGVAVTLEGLDHAHIEELARWALPDLPAAQRERVVRRAAHDSAGVPLLTVAILRAVADGLDLGSVPSGWPEPLRTLDQTLPGQLPQTVVAAVRVQFRQLSEDAQGLAAAAAVLGDRVDPEHVMRVANLAADQGWRAFDELERQGWLQADSAGYAFVAAIIRDIIARDLITPGQRRRLEAADPI